MKTYSYAQQKFLVDILRLTANIAFSILVLFLLSTLSISPWAALTISATTAFILATVQRMTWPWKLLHGILLPALICSLIISNEYNYFPALFLLCTLPVALAYGPTIWTRVPFYRTTEITVATLNSLIYNYRITRMLDVGSGNGKVLSLLSQSKNSNIVLHGIELSPLLWLISWFRSFVTPGTRYFLGSYWKHSFAPYDCIYVFLSPQPMADLWQKACWEMAPGSLIISYQFEVPQKKPLREVTIPHSNTKLYMYKIP
jgi:hypothetical protein